MDRNTYTHSYILTAGETNAEGRMPLTLLMERVIEVATEHANALGIGYATLIKRNVGWVLSRVSIEMQRYPVINDAYTLTTWIECYNRRFSERNIRVSDGEGNVIGYVRTVWVAMDFATRSVADLAELGEDAFPVSDTPCPIAKAARIAVIPEDAVEAAEDYVFRYCDVDFNRHVNTVRYLELILNHWPLDWYDCHTLRRFDVHFHHECHYGEAVSLRVTHIDGNGTQQCEIVRPGGIRAVAARMLWSEE